jgi:glycosyl transferase, family 25
MKIHVINLKESVERRRSITTQLNRLNLAFELFDAIKGVDIPDYELEQKVDMAEVKKYPYWLTKGILGASLSHMGVYKRIACSEESLHLVLEDDVVLSKDIVHVLSEIEKNGSYFEDHLLLLYGINIHDRIMLSKANSKTISGYKFYKVENSGISGGGAYIVHKKTAMNFLEKNPKIKVGPDSWSNFLAEGVYKQIDCIYPFVARPGYFESGIGYLNKSSKRYRMKLFLKKYRLPFFDLLLKYNRKRIWKKTSKVVFV